MTAMHDGTETARIRATPAEIAQIKQRAAILSVMATLLLTGAKIVGAILSGSLALLTDALQGLIDVGSTLFTWFAVRVADKPADDEHHYGHGKVEALAALVETAILFTLAGAILWEAGSRLWAGLVEHVQVTPLVIGIMLLSMTVDAIRWRSLTRVAKETGSEALSAEATHFSADFVGSALVLAGLVGVWYGVARADTIAAFAVAAFTALSAYRLGRRTLDTLLDAAPRGASERLREAAEAVPGVVGVNWLKIRPTGGRINGEIGISVSRTLPLERVAAIREALGAAFQAIEPGAEIAVTTDPVQVDDETALERVLLIALKLKIPVHHVTVHSIGQRLSVSLDMEVEASLPLGQAHEIASRLEAAIRAEFGGETEVETHIEPMETSTHSGHDAAWDTVEDIGKALAAEATQLGGPIHDIHGVRVRQTMNGLVVNYHCRVDPALDVASVHAAVDQIERAVRIARPQVCRLVSHAEPAIRGAAS
ncbi:cation diffusion facilitator family transporter [Bosea sp. 124]|uniref:cation diffusion facilitator family transporter n=1 Tax=Bosea sp. 124 TaxID=2135642 RepID=UPI000D4AB6A4|nr:cation diffusion facilitator family transporter [Bosea sp. 124]PTM38713.1 cation diffusion facilitator family transporter [Bosea sp. 124]